MAVLSEWITANVTEKEKKCEKGVSFILFKNGKNTFFSLSLRVSIYLPEMLEKNTHFLQLYLNHLIVHLMISLFSQQIPSVGLFVQKVF